jgi:hypothetical protein
MSDSTGKVEGSFREKIKICGMCDFCHLMKEQEGEGMIPSMLLLKKVEENE